MLKENTTELNHDLVETASSLRNAVCSVLSAIGVRETRPMELSKRLGLDKSLSWKLVQIMNASEPAAIIEQIPGSSAFAIFIRALVKIGAPEQLVTMTAGAHARFEEAVEKHVGDRATLELVIDSLSGKRRGKFETSRKLAFRGNSGIWGVQCRARISAGIMMPDAEDPTYLDSALIGAWVDFRRLRPDAKWVMFRRMASTRDTSVAGRPQPEPIDREMDDSDLGLLKGFCSSNMPQIHPVQDEADPRMLTYELGQSEVGNTGAFTCYFGTRVRKLGSIRAGIPSGAGTFGAQVSAPVEKLICDTLVHKDMGLEQPPIARVLGTIVAGFSPNKDRDVLPIDEQVLPLESTLSALETPDIPEYSSVMGHVLRKLGHSIENFKVYRYELEYPPFPSTVLMSVPLLQP